MATKQELICQMSAQLMTKIMTNSPEQNRAYVKQSVETAVMIYDLVEIEVKAVKET